MMLLYGRNFIVGGGKRKYVEEKQILTDAFTTTDFMRQILGDVGIGVSFLRGFSPVHWQKARQIS